MPFRSVDVVMMGEKPLLVGFVRPFDVVMRGCKKGSGCMINLF
jgi:hypothetical protein